MNNSIRQRPALPRSLYQPSLMWTTALLIYAPGLYIVPALLLYVVATAVLALGLQLGVLPANGADGNGSAESIPLQNSIQAIGATGVCMVQPGLRHFLDSVVRNDRHQMADGWARLHLFSDDDRAVHCCLSNVYRPRGSGRRRVRERLEPDLAADDRRVLR